MGSFKFGADCNIEYDSNPNIVLPFFPREGAKTV